MSFFHWLTGKPTWIPGRREMGGGYEKMLLASIAKTFDCWLIRVPATTRIHSNRDEVAHGRHYRLNIALKLPEDSKFQLGGWPIFQVGQRIILFRPDKCNHWLNKASGERLFGLVL